MGPLKRDYMGSNITQVVEACLDISFSYSCASLCGCLRGARRQPSRTLCLMNSSTANFNGLLKHSNYKHDTEILWFMIPLRTDFIRQTLLIAFSRLFPDRRPFRIPLLYYHIANVSDGQINQGQTTHAYRTVAMDIFTHTAIPKCHLHSPEKEQGLLGRDKINPTPLLTGPSG